MRRAHVASTFVLSALLVLLGVAMVVSTLARGGGPLAFGVVIGVMLAVFGGVRLWFARGGTR